jgi:AcrR family transcriptional regulator
MANDGWSTHEHVRYVHAMSPGKPAPISRRERPAKPALTREGIVATALEVMRAEGLDRVTMRRLAQELDTGPASFYVYMANTAELHAYMLDELLKDVDLSPVAAAGDWRDRLVNVLSSYTAVLIEHPGLAQSALVTRPTGPGFLVLVDGLLALLMAELPGDQASWALDLLLHFATSSAVEQGIRRRAIDATDEDAQVVTAILDASDDTYPHIAALGMELLSGTGPDRMTWGFHVLINGVLETPTAPHRREGK